MKIRPAMSMLLIDESMSQVTEVSTLEALRTYVKHRFDFWQPTDDNIEVQYYGFDERPESGPWGDTFLITVDGKAALFSDRSFDETSLDRLRRRSQRNPSDTLLAEVVQDLEEYEHSFELRWKADMRAIKRWHEAGGNEMTRPDHADLCVWLMGQLSPTPGTPARSQGNDDAKISDGSADHGEAVAPGMDQSRA